MTNRYRQLAFGERARARQGTIGSEDANGVTAENMTLGDREVAMVTGAFQLHLGTVTPSGWPYVQYRSGPAGFVHHLGGNRIGFADHRGNRQFVSVGNIETDGRVALYVADLPRRLRLKLFGTAQVVDAADDPMLLDDLRRLPDGRTVSAECERSIVVEVEAFDWNCARSLVPQYTDEQIRRRIQPYIDEITALRAEVDALRTQRASPSSDQ